MRAFLPARANTYIYLVFSTIDIPFVPGRVS
jgi:hypothetical protein